MTQSLRRVSFFIGTLAALALVGGCSESHVGDVLDSGGDRDASFPAMDGSLHGGDSGPPTMTDTGPPDLTDSGWPDLVDAGPPDPGTDSGGAPVDAGVPDPMSDAGSSTTTDAGATSVTCGTATCVDPQICCVTFAGGGMTTMACTAPSACMGVAAACDGPEDCASGEACCGMRSAGGTGSTACVASAMCRFGRLCHADADCSGTDTCCAFMGATVCSPFCP